MSIDLRPVEQDDLAVFFEHQCEEGAAQMAGFEPRDRRAFMAHWQRSLSDRANVMRTILSNGRVAGNVVCWTAGEERLVGYWIGREHWGRGVATGALALFVDERPERPLHARVAPHNVASMRVLEKCGFIVESRDDEDVVYRLDAR